MASERYEIRLDSEHRRKLSELAAVRDAPASEVVREMIDEAYEDVLREERRNAARELAAMEIEDVPDPETVSRQLESAHDPGIP
jgi:predicted transcriptional regulator